jgi:hypothetical protein
MCVTSSIGTISYAPPLRRQQLPIREPQAALLVCILVQHRLQTVFDFKVAQTTLHPNCSYAGWPNQAATDVSSTVYCRRESLLVSKARCAFCMEHSAPLVRHKRRPLH